MAIPGRRTHRPRTEVGGFSRPRPPHDIRLIDYPNDVFHVLTTTYTKPVDVVDQTRPAHVAWLNDEVAAGRILAAGRLESATGAVLITSDISEDEVTALIARDPYAQADLIEVERVSFNGSIRAPGL